LQFALQADELATQNLGRLQQRLNFLPRTQCHSLRQQQMGFQFRQAALRDAEKLFWGPAATRQFTASLTS
jgi:hypothetical protein